MSVRISKELLKRLDTAAERQRRNRANMVLVMIEDWLDLAETKEKQGKNDEDKYVRVFGRARVNLRREASAASAAS